MAVGTALAYDESYKADADLRTYQYRFVTIQAATGGVTVTGANGVPHGILQNDPNTGETARVRHLGISELIANGTVNIAIGDKIESGAAGIGLKITAAENWLNGIAMDAATTATSKIRVLLQGPYSD